MTAWKIAPGEGAWVWDDCVNRNCITINWLDGVDLTEFRDRAAVTRALVKADPHNGIRGAASIWPFVHEVRQGDRVIANDGLIRVVGIGIVRSGYLAPDDRRNPNRGEHHHRHARLVDWIIDKPVDLGTKLFNQPTVQQLDGAQCHVIAQAYLKADPKLKATLHQLFGAQAAQSNPGPAADESDAANDSPYEATAGDLRQMAWQQIKKRRGQPRFRRELMQRYGKRCMVTGCDIEAVLEAAHIDPYRGESNNHAANGLLLRADIHTLFDLNLLGIEPTELRVELHLDIAEVYRNVVRKKGSSPVSVGEFLGCRLNSGSTEGPAPSAFTFASPQRR